MAKAVSELRVSRCAVSMADAVSMASPFLAALFEWLKPFLCFAFLAALFEWLTPFQWLRVSRCAVSMAKAVLMASPFLATLFNFVEGFAVQCLKPFLGFSPPELVESWRVATVLMINASLILLYNLLCVKYL